VAELYEHTAAELAAMVRDGEVSSREVIEAHLARIEAANPHVNAITVVLSESALAAADRIDHARRSGEGIGPLSGVPFTVKENIDCLGSATTHGVPAHREALPYRDAPAVARLKAAGAIPIGRTNLSEMGLRLCTQNPLRGVTRNPRDPRLTAGGSSGGDAAAVATGMTPIGLGNDIGGSLRVPAHCCGIAALKPTTGRIPHAASLPPYDHGIAGQVMLSLGPMARSVADLRLCLSVLSGRDLRDPRSVDVPLRGAEPEERCAALVTHLPDASIAADTLSALERAEELLQKAGWAVEHATPPEVPRVGDIWHKLLATDLSVVMPKLRGMVTAHLYDHVMQMCQRAKLHEASSYRLHEERSRLMRTWSGFFAEYPVVVGPNMLRAPWPLGADLDPDTGPELLTAVTRFILPASALSLPVVVVPVGMSGALPNSVQIYADLWREDWALEVAEILEAEANECRPIDPATIR
jgi:amidase